jgi:hypothetical protein
MAERNITLMFPTVKGMCDVPHIRLYYTHSWWATRRGTTAIKSPAAGQLNDERGVIIVLLEPGDMAIDAD